MAQMPIEYGSTSPIMGKNGEKRQRIILGLCAVSMFLVVLALAGNRGSSGPMSLEEKMQALKASQSGEVAHVAAAVPSVAEPKETTAHQQSDVKPAEEAKHDAVEPKATEPKATEPKAVAPEAKPAVAAAVKEAVVAPAKEEQAAAVKPAEEAAKPAAPVAVKQADVVSPKAEIQPAAKSAVAEAIAASKRQLALAHLAHIATQPAAHMLAANATSDDAASSGASTSASGSEAGAAAGGAGGFNSPLGNMEPTGIMSVFFNEKIMLTALGVIGGLLILICCFARNADCALS